VKIFFFAPAGFCGKIVYSRKREKLTKGGSTPIKTTEAYYKTIKHYFQSFFEWLDQIPDWRDQDRITYTVRELMGTGLSMFLLKLESRRQWNEERGRDQFDTNASAFFQAGRIAHGDSLNYFLRGLPQGPLHQVRLKMVRQLIRGKVLEKFRVQGYYLVVFDGTRTIRFGHPHCPECLSQKLNNGQTVYYHPVLEAKLVCNNGLAISLGTEFLRNQDGATKQDCELKAFYRLARKLKQDFPQLRVCMVADGLYAGEPTFRLCQELNWAYLIVLQDEDLSTVWEQIQGLRGFLTKNRRTQRSQRPNGTTVQETCHWSTHLFYRELTVHVLEYEQQIEDQKPSRWAWITNLEIT
jgi:hypothetical protein